jgi:2C-methyl-D-erythritol 2,4-cyclodiphosphate synthase
MVEGVVYRVFEKPTKFGKMYSVKLMDDPQYYGTGRNAPPVREGQQVQFNASQNERGYWDADVKSFKVVEASVSAAPSARSSIKVNAKDDYWTRKEERDLLNDKLRNIGAARNTAIEFVKFIVAQEAVTLPTKKADKADALLALVEHYRAEFQKVEETKAPDTGEEEVIDDLKDAGEWN